MKKITGIKELLKTRTTYKETPNILARINQYLQTVLDSNTLIVKEVA